MLGITTTMSRLTGVSPQRRSKHSCSAAHSSTHCLSTARNSALSDGVRRLKTSAILTWVWRKTSYWWWLKTQTRFSRKCSKSWLPRSTRAAESPTTKMKGSSRLSCANSSTLRCWLVSKVSMRMVNNKSRLSAHSLTTRSKSRPTSAKHPLNSSVYMPMLILLLIRVNLTVCYSKY